MVVAVVGHSGLGGRETRRVAADQPQHAAAGQLELGAAVVASTSSPAIRSGIRRQVSTTTARRRPLSRSTDRQL